MTMINGHGRKPYFFLSYVHDQGEDDRSVREFFDKLHHDVQLRSGFRHDPVGFCDTTLRAGDRWSPKLVDALCTCTAFVPLCSPTYFRSEACGKEWWIFRRRMLGQRPRGGASSLIPLTWIVPFDMPDIVRDIQYRDGDFGTPYAQLGLRDLIQVPDYQLGYRTFLNALAERIITLARTVTIPAHPDRPGFLDVPAAFASDGPRAPLAPRPRPGGDEPDGQPPAPPTTRPHLNPNMRRPARRDTKDERR